MQQEGTILVVGAGALGSALVRGMAQDPARRDRIQVVDTEAVRADELAEETGVTATSLDQIEQPAAMILLVVKPPDVETAVKSLGAAVGEHTVLISCAAGVSMAAITYALGTEARLVRAMPNVAARVRASATVLAAGKHVSADDLIRVVALFAAVGKVVRAPSEESLHAVTALAASGPAFLALVLEALMDAGVYAGLTRDLAEELTVEMANGTMALLNSGLTPAELRAQVTSPAGTTAAGLAQLERSAMRGVLGDAVAAAAERSRELAG